MSNANILAGIRDLIKNDKIEKAFDLVHTLVPPDLNNTLIIIENRYKKWKKDRMLGLGNNMSDRNVIVNDLLDLLGEVEKYNDPELSDNVAQAEIINRTAPARQAIAVRTQKPWYEKISVLVPVIVALISGSFLLLQTFMSKDRNTKEKFVTYELIFIDRQTMQPPVFHTIEPKIKIYSKTPPEVLPIILGTVKFEGPTDLESQKIIVEFENIDEYQIVDRYQVIKAGKNEIYIDPGNKKQIQ
jgi:hypothetical protein